MKGQPSPAFLFVQELTEAIEQYAASTEARDRSAFLHRGQSLKRAWQSHLYFYLVNHEAFAQAYFGGKNDKSGTVVVEHETQRQLLSIIFGRGVNVRLPGNRSLGQLRRVRNWVRRRMSGRGAGREPAPDKIAEATTDETLVFVGHEKFVRYVLPVSRVSNHPFRFVGGDPRTKEYLAANGLPSRRLEAGVEGSAPSKREDLHGLQDLASQYDRIRATLLAHRPRSVLVLEGNSPDDRLVGEACRELGVVCLCLQHGWSPFVHSGFRHMTFSKMLVWGDAFGELLRPYNPSQSFVSVGNHAIHPARESDQKAIGFFLQAPGLLIDGHAWSGLLRLVERAATELSSTRIIVRQHPGFQLSPLERQRLARLPNVALVSPGNVSLSEMLRECRMSVSIYSTVILESIGAGVIPLIFNQMSLPRYWPDIAAEGAGIETADPREAIEAMRSAIVDDMFFRRHREAMLQLRPRYFSDFGEVAARRIASEIEATASGPASTAAEVPVP